MNGRRLFRKKSIIISWLLAYCTIILVLVLLVVLINHYSVKAIMDETVSSNNHFALAIGNDIDKALMQAKNVYKEIYLSQNFNSLCKSSSRDPHTLLDIYHLNNEIKSINATFSFIETTIAYFPAIDTVVSDQASLGADSYFSFFLKGGDLSYKDYITLLNEKSRNRFVMPSDAGHESIYYAVSSPAVLGDLRANVMIKISKSKLREMVSRYFDGQINSVGIASPSGDIVLIHDTTSEEQKQKLVGALQSENESGGITSEGMVLSSVKSSESEWTYFYFSAANEYWERALELKRFSMLMLWGGLLLCALGVILSLIKSYRPVKQLVDYIGGIIPAVNDFANEYEILDNALQYMHRENERNCIILNETRTRLRGEYIGGILNGQLTPDEYTYGQREYFSGNRFMVALVDFDCDDPLKSAHIAEKNDVLRAAFISSVSQLSGGRQSLFDIGLNDVTAVLINLADDEQDDTAIEELSFFLRQAAQTVETFYMAQTYVTVPTRFLRIQTSRPQACWPITSSATAPASPAYRKPMCSTSTTRCPNRKPRLIPGPSARRRAVLCLL